MYKRTQEGLELLDSTSDLTYIKLSKFRSLKINSADADNGGDFDNEYNENSPYMNKSPC